MPRHFLSTKQRQGIFLTTKQCRSNIFDNWHFWDFWLLTFAFHCFALPCIALHCFALLCIALCWQSKAMPKHFLQLSNAKTFFWQLSNANALVWQQSNAEAIFWQLTFWTFLTFDFGSRNQARLCRPRNQAGGPTEPGLGGFWVCIVIRNLTTGDTRNPGPTHPGASYRYTLAPS